MSNSNETSHNQAVLNRIKINKKADETIIKIIKELTK